VFLDDPDLHPRLRRRMALTRELIADQARAVEQVDVEATTRLDRLVSMVLLGDLVSIYLAALRGVDPGDIALLAEFKSRMKDD
jgi:glucose/mannose-6-phosphate isomerase